MKRSFFNHCKIAISLILGISLLGCQPEKKNDSSTAAVLLLAATTTSGDCVVNTSGKGAISTFVTDLTVSGVSKTGTISKIGSVPIVGHQTAVIKITTTAPTTITLTGNAFAILYKSDACPLAASAALAYNSGFATTAADATSEFPTSHKVVTSSVTTIATSGTYYYFFYAIPSRGQTATLTYTVAP